MSVQLPLANQPLEGPVVPAGTGGGSLYAEIYDSATGEKLSKDAAPIKF